MCRLTSVVVGTSCALSVGARSTILGLFIFAEYTDDFIRLSSGSTYATTENFASGEKITGARPMTSCRASQSYHARREKTENGTCNEGVNNNGTRL